MSNACKADWLHVGGLILSANGKVFGFPSDGSQARLKPGQRHTFTTETFVAGKPYSVEDYIMVFATGEHTPTDWRILTTTSRERMGMINNALTRALDRYLTPGRRGTAASYREDSTWTMTLLPIQTMAPGQGGPIQTKPAQK